MVSASSRGIVESRNVIKTGVDPGLLIPVALEPVKLPADIVRTSFGKAVGRIVEVGKLTLIPANF